MKFSTRLAYDWALRCFGAWHVANRQVRSLRIDATRKSSQKS